MHFMGNCIDTLCPSSEIFNEEEEEEEEEIGYKKFEFPERKIISGNVNSLHGPPFTGSCKPPVSQKMEGEEDGCGVRSIKVVLTKKQLEELLLLSSIGKGGGRRGGVVISSVEEFAERVLETSLVGKPDQKWKPSLSTVPESLVC